MEMAHFKKYRSFKCLVRVNCVLPFIIIILTRRRLKAFTRNVPVYVRTILNGVGQLSSTWVGTICERETEMFSIRV